MEKFIPYEKLSKKEQKKLNNKKRNVWEVSPIPKIIPNKKKGTQGNVYED